MQKGIFKERQSILLRPLNNDSLSEQKIILNVIKLNENLNLNIKLII